MKKIQFFFILLLFLNTIGCFQSAKKSLSEKTDTIASPIDTIPFTLTPYDNISITTILNERDTLDLMFHTAANSVTLIKEAVERISSPNFNQKDTVKSWGGESEARYSLNNTLQIGRLRFDSLTIHENERSGRLTDGKFGPNFFNDKILEIDFDNSYLLLHTALPQKATNFEQLPLEYTNGFMFITGQLEVEKEQLNNLFLIHTGYSGTLLLDDEFVNSNEIGGHLEVISESELQDAYGNVLKTKKAILPALHFGEAGFSDVPVGFFEGAIGRQKMSVIGCGLLKRFNVMIDFEEKSIYLKKNVLSDLPYSNN